MHQTAGGIMVRIPLVVLSEAEIRIAQAVRISCVQLGVRVAQTDRARSEAACKSTLCGARYQYFACSANTRTMILTIGAAERITCNYTCNNGPALL